MVAPSPPPCPLVHSLNPLGLGWAGAEVEIEGQEDNAVSHMSGWSLMTTPVSPAWLRACAGRSRREEPGVLRGLGFYFGVWGGLICCFKVRTTPPRLGSGLLAATELL